MKASKSLRRPTNWQDFETLCKKLWGEIWDCPEIKKNGRVGQNQNGVDVYGIPKGETSYFGIQCKGKDEYTDKQFSEEELNKEIEKAKSFKPLLKKFYFTTTAVKDTKIEEFVRQKNIEHIEAGFFEVHIFSWEDIVELIDENRHTHDWYVRSQNFKVEQSAILTFQDDSQQLNASVKFRRRVIDYKQTIVLANPLFNQFVFPNAGNTSSIQFFPSHYDKSINYSYYKFNFRLCNNGISPIEEFKIFFELDGDYQDFVRPKNWSGMFPPANSIPYDTFLNDDKTGGKIISRSNIIVSDDIIGFDKLTIKPLHEPSSININWRLTSRDYKTDGQLRINFTPEIIREHETVLIEDPLKVRIVEGEIEDFIAKPD